MASRASELPPGRSVTAGIIIVGDEILKVCLELKREGTIFSCCGLSFRGKGDELGWESSCLPCSGSQHIGGKVTLLLLSFSVERWVATSLQLMVVGGAEVEEARV